MSRSGEERNHKRREPACDGPTGGGQRKLQVRSRISELASDGCRWPHAAGGVNVSGESAGVRVCCTCGLHRHLYWHLNFRGIMGGTAEAGGQLAGWAVCCCVYTGEGPVDGLCLFVSCLLSLWIVLRAFLVLMLPLLLLL